MNVYVNGNPVPHRPFREDEYGPLMEHQDDGIHRTFLVLEPLEPCVAGDDITCDPPADTEQVWVKVPITNWRGEVTHGNMRLHPEQP